MNNYCLFFCGLVFLFWKKKKHTGGGIQGYTATNLTEIRLAEFIVPVVPSFFVKRGIVVKNPVGKMMYYCMGNSIRDL